jgi:hypothetical protein
VKIDATVQASLHLFKREQDCWNVNSNFRSTKETMRLIACLLLSAIVACTSNADKSVYLPSKHYQFVKIDTTALPEKHAVYVPVYSHIYLENGRSTVNLAVTLSIRNTSFADSIYITDVVYYGSQGEVLKRYLDSTVLIKPMASIEFVVERSESKGGAGANFVVKWGASKPGSEPLMQTVMNETSAGISFVTNGVEMK